jgi:hypothetical protein
MQEMYRRDVTVQFFVSLEKLTDHFRIVRVQRWPKKFFITALKALLSESFRAVPKALSLINFLIEDQQICSLLFLLH